jgi:hypothetical protein
VSDDLRAKWSFEYRVWWERTLRDGRRDTVSTAPFSSLKHVLEWARAFGPTVTDFKITDIDARRVESYVGMLVPAGTPVLDYVAHLIEIDEQTAVLRAAARSSL